MDRTLTDQSSVLITGTTGLIGGELLARMIHNKIGCIRALVRPNKKHTPTTRLQKRLAESGYHAPLPMQLEVVPGDITQVQWGLEQADYQRIVDDVEIIIHNAADTSFAAHRHPEETNISSVEWLIKLARSCRKIPLIVYMSSASNVGNVHNVCVKEEEGCRPTNGHFNSYTQSKAVAENLLKSSGLPVLTLRPTIVLSAGLANKRFASQILWCLPVTRLFKALPLDAFARLDLVDVGFVADVTLALLKKADRRFDCYHLSAGPRNAVSLQQVATLLDHHYGRRPLQLIPPDKWSDQLQGKYVHNRLQQLMYESLTYYLPFLNMDVVYDDRRVRHELGKACPPVRDVEEYLPELADIISAKSAIMEAALP